MDKIKDRLKNVKSIINSINPNAKLVVVSKFFPEENILEVLNEGHNIFGESKAQELRDKYENLKNKKIEWHFIGSIQTNKIKYIVPICDLIHSVYREKEIKEIDKRAKENGKIQQILLEVNVSGEESKSGININSVKNLLNSSLKFENIRVVGLMTMAPLTENEEIIRSTFKKLKDLKEELKDEYKDLKELSMGMSNDFKIALEEGATIVRIGSKIFGKRNY
ncbi:YggS family pyridoxal phosphate-dependent enzyme [Geotoga petraea]|jgi:pyridoxal phosphate enzyme (YggS family)|uniref:Pyridoxal phosphate homeostasis protein n=1 Tax=Geotoga petraea TaxID=28234 RepID=A0A4Z0W2Y8_9BACT|nr:YggS family pyridoxal phosphate-dependent enzyme [Geotoga petraea]MDK2946424.1 dependent protein [Geotoga sp.]TGG88229.1 YggS family pyridoxal phosphate-dependent enzyme [Geotoga petraea]